MQIEKNLNIRNNEFWMKIIFKIKIGDFLKL